MNKDRLVYKIYKERREEFIRNDKKDKKNWCYWTWKALQQLNLEHVWESEQIQLGSNFNNIVRKLIKIKEENEWRERMEKKSKLRLYRKLKNRLRLEDYVVELDREQRRLLTMLRGGTNKLGIERGRWRERREHERLCPVCLCQEIEDERHFLLACPMYVRERVKMFERIREECELEYVEEMNEEWQLNILIGIGWRKQSKDIREIVIEYIRKAFEIRKRYV
jgi:hypothetical protein